MTATIKPHKRHGRKRPRPVRFASMESLGFSDTRSVWSDNPVPTRVEIPPTPQQPAIEDAPITDWEPTALGDRLGGSRLRWGVVVAVLVAIVGTAAVGLWLYQRPQTEAKAAVAALDTEAGALAASLPALETLNAALTDDFENLSSIDTTTVDEASRRLFDAGSALPASESESRVLATGAASSALDGVRLAEEARAYSLAVDPVLASPGLETDPAVIALDDAARSFGVWQLRFDDVRTALPDSVFPDVTQQMDVLSGRLADILSRYVDGLRSDDQAAADAVVVELEDRLANVSDMLHLALVDVQDRVEHRIAEARLALDDILGH